MRGSPGGGLCQLMPHEGLLSADLQDPLPVYFSARTEFKKGE